MFGTPLSNNYDETHININDSTIKTKVDLFYETYIENDISNYHYEQYLADTLFCGDKSLASGYSKTNSGFGETDTYYAASDRFDSSNLTPTLECAKGENNTYSRYTKNSTETTKGVKLNNDLDYSIGLLSADEVVMAGASSGKMNDSYFLYDFLDTDYAIYDCFWLMTPNAHFPGPFARNYTACNTSPSLDTTMYNPIEGSVRPVINLKANSVVTGGNGTKGSPYTIY